MVSESGVCWIVFRPADRISIKTLDARFAEGAYFQAVPEPGTTISVGLPLAFAAFRRITKGIALRAFIIVADRVLQIAPELAGRRDLLIRQAVRIFACNLSHIGLSALGGTK